MKTQLTQAEQERLDTIFTYHAPNDQTRLAYQAIRDGFKGMAAMVLMMVPPGREQALALTNIEQAVMWANAGIARQPGSEPER